MTHQLHHPKPGFSIAEVIIILVIVTIVGLGGWYVYNATTTQPATNNTQPKPASDPYAEWVEYSYVDTEGGGKISYKYPADWKIEGGIDIASPDLARVPGRATVASGSWLRVYSDRYGLEDHNKKPLDFYLQQEMIGMSDERAEFHEYLTVDGNRTIKFTHCAGENLNNNTVAVFFEGKSRYVIDHQYKFGSSNPHPDVLAGVLATLKFEK